jgi:protein SCO1/2
MKRSNFATTARAAVVGIALAMGASPAFAGGPTARPLPSDSVYQLALPLTDQAGRTADWRNLRGKPRVVSMFYTSCQYICPLIVDSGKAIEHQLSPAERGRIGIVLISMDPARDTPAALRKVFDKRGLDAAAGCWPRRPRRTFARSPACSASATGNSPMASSTTPAR